MNAALISASLRRLRRGRFEGERGRSSTPLTTLKTAVLAEKTPPKFHAIENTRNSPLDANCNLPYYNHRLRYWV
jgi:hypothetical protein